MAVNIKEIDSRSIEINGKLVTKTMTGEWVCRFTELTPIEEKALYDYLRAIELNVNRRLN